MTPKEKKAFVKKMREAKEAKAKGKKKPEYDLIQKRKARNTSKAGTLQARENLKNIKKKWDIEEQTKLAKRYGAKGRAIMRKRSKQ